MTAMLAIVFLLLGSATAWAQLSGAGAITGMVEDSTGAAIPGATLTVTKNSTGVATISGVR